ncbi:MAG: hypothetical protein GY788_17320 [bacterium]|nr:hypothetical protein [bacterium]
MKKPTAKEHQLQKFVVDLMRIQGVPGLIFYHIPNEGQRAPRTGAFLKRLGMLPGAADIAIVLPGGQARFLELKRERKAKTSDDQIAFHELCAENGTPYAIIKTPEQAAQILLAWGAIKTNPLAAGRAA